MRGAFVVQLGSGREPAHDQFEGWVKEVESGKQLRFRSTQELHTFMSRRMQAASGPQDVQDKAGGECAR